MTDVLTGELVATRAPSFDRRVLLAIPQWDYGDPARGPSFEQTLWLAAVRSLTRACEVVWYDRAMHEPGSVDAELLAAVDRFAPDLVMFFPFRDDTAPETLRALMDRTATFAFFWDDQWRFESYSSRYATLYTYVATTEPSAVPRFRALGGSPILTQYGGLLVGGVEPPLDDDARFRHDVSFVGGANPYRLWLVDWLRRHGVSVECFGAGWPNGRLGYAEMEEVFRASRVNLNLSNSKQYDTRYLLADPANFHANRESPKAAEQIKARHFEIPMAGGFQLSYYVPGLEDWLEIGREIAIYSGPDDCLRQIERALAEPARRIATAQAGWRRSLAEHTYDARVAAMFEHIWG